MATRRRAIVTSIAMLGGLVGPLAAQAANPDTGQRADLAATATGDRETVTPAGMPGGSSLAAGPVGTGDAGYTALTPVRVLDTRDGTGTAIAGAVAPGSTLRLGVNGTAGLPATGVGAVALNVTATDAVGAGFLTVRSCDQSEVATSNLNVEPGRAVANLVVSAVGATGEVCITTSAPMQVIADVNGWFAAGKGFSPLPATRLVDTRSGHGGVPIGKVAADGTVRFNVAGAAGVPASGAAAVALNLTLTDAAPGTYATVWPCAEGRPSTSNVNATSPAATANAVIAPIDVSGAVCIGTSAPAHVIADLSGWFAADQGFHSVAPVRAFDTRAGQGGVGDAPVVADRPLRFKVAGRFGTTAGDLSAVALNVTLADAAPGTYLTVWPCDGLPPAASNVNAAGDGAVANAVLARVSPTGEVCFASSAPTDLIVDVNGWFGMPEPDPGPGPGPGPGPDPEPEPEPEPVYGDPGRDTIWRETFDGPTTAWDVTTTGATGTSYAGWQFVDRALWFADAAPVGIGCDPEVDAPLDARCFLDSRNQFTRADATLAIVDNGLLAAKGGTVDGTLTSTLTSPGIDVAGHDEVELAFDAHYRQAFKAVGTVTASFDGGEPMQVVRLSAARTSTNGGGDFLAGQPVTTIDVPAGASTMVLRFTYTSGQSVHYWAIDDVIVRTPLAPLPERATGTEIHVVSDIQSEGIPYVTPGLQLLHDKAPDAAAMLLVGDIISGPRDQTQEQQVAEYQEVTTEFEKGPLAPAVISAIGNHDTRSRVMTKEQQIVNFLAFANKWGVNATKPYYEHVAGGVPVLVIGTEGTGPDSVNMSNDQLQWIDSRLDYWTALGKQVLIISHHVLPWTVSGSYGNFYNDDFGVHLQPFLDVLGDHPNAILFTAHTHWHPSLRDWSVREVVAGGDPNGFTVVNTGAMAMEFGPSPTDPWDEDSMTDRPESPAVSTLTVYPDRAVITAYNVLTGQQINEVVVENPLVS